MACGLGVAIVPASCATLPIRQGVVFRRMTGSRYNSRLVLVAAERRTLDDWSAQAIALAVDELHAIESSLLAIGNG